MVTRQRTKLGLMSSTLTVADQGHIPFAVNYTPWCIVIADMQIFGSMYQGLVRISIVCRDSLYSFDQL